MGIKRRSCKNIPSTQYCTGLPQSTPSRIWNYRMLFRRRIYIYNYLGHIRRAHSCTWTLAFSCFHKTFCLFWIILVYCRWSVPLYHVINSYFALFTFNWENWYPETRIENVCWSTRQCHFYDIYLKSKTVVVFDFVSSYTLISVDLLTF